MDMLMICSSGMRLTLGARQGLTGLLETDILLILWTLLLDSLWCASVGGGGSRRTLDVVGNLHICGMPH
jgi:hypothetical protein